MSALGGLGRWAAAAAVGLVGGVAGAGAGASLASSPAWARPIMSAAPARHPLRSGPAKPVILRGPDRLQLLSQPAWVGPAHSEFQLRLKVTASAAGDEELGVFIYGALTARSEFQADLGGGVEGFPYDTPPAVPLEELPAGPGGAADLDIPVNQPGSSADFSTGVYPVLVFLEKGGVRVGQPITTFLVYAGADASHLQRLNVGVVVPLVTKVSLNPGTGAPGAVPSGATFWLRADVADLARYHVPVTIAGDVPTLEALGRSGPSGALALNQLRVAVSSGDELLPSTSLPVDMAALVASRLTGYLRALVADGSEALTGIVGAAPTSRTWAVNGALGPSSMAALASMGASQVVVPQTDLSTLPAQYQDLTFAQPAELSLPGNEIDVIGADSELALRVSQAAAPGQAVLVANQVLAELAMIDLEAPGVVRGVVLLPTPGTTINPTFLSVLLSGLRSDPLLQARTLAGEFRTVPLEELAGGKPMVRSLEGPAPHPLAGTGQLSQAFRSLSAAQEVFGAGSALVSELGQQLTVSLSSDWSVAQRESMIAGVVNAARSELGKVSLAPSISITLASHQGRLPLTVLSSAGTPARVHLVLSSEELSFLPQRFAPGQCRPVGPGSETCDLVLAKTTTLQVPVAVRTSGVFQLSLTLESPDGNTVMSSTTDTVRSTATNGVALALMMGAALFLAVWWLRNARHGRRAQKLVPRPAEDDPAEDDPAEDDPAEDEVVIPGPVALEPEVVLEPQPVRDLPGTGDPTDHLGPGFGERPQAHVLRPAGGPPA